jgi:hypothetical protein
LQHQGQAFEGEPPFGCSQIRGEMNIHGVGPFMTSAVNERCEANLMIACPQSIGPALNKDNRTTKGLILGLVVFASANIFSTETKAAI